LQTVVAAEKMKITEDALELVAASAEGSLRDAESLLDQITSLKEKVEVEDVEKTIGKVGWGRTGALAELILKKDLKGSLAYLREISDGGYNLVDLNKELIHYLRRAVSLKLDATLENLFKKELTARELSQLKNHAGLIQEKTYLVLLKSLIRAYSEMRYSPFAAIPLEVAIIENLQ
jgi:DNA polymerase-3 subunit gamma/tau